MKKCPVCNSINSFIVSSIETYCKVCGYVAQNYVYGKDFERVGPPSTYKYHDKGGSSQIYIPYHEATFATNRLQKFHKYVRVSGKGEKALSEYLTDFDVKCNMLNIPKDVREIGRRMLHDYVKNKGTKGRKMEYVSGALIYLISRVYKLPVTMKEVLSTVSIKSGGRDEKRRRVFFKNYRKMVSYFGIHPPIQTPLTYVAKFCERMGLSTKSFEVEREVRILCKKIQKEIKNYNPIILTIALIVVTLTKKYNICYDLDKAGQIFKVSPNSISKNIKTINEVLEKCEQD